MAAVRISDIAATVGLSKGAVSLALNDKPGVSEQTRARVRATAERLGWAPNDAARALARSRADSIGLALCRPAAMLGLEPFYMEFISGIEQSLAPQGFSLTLQIVSDHETELATYRKWWRARRVDGVLLVDLIRDDVRPARVRELGLPAVCVSAADAAGDLPYVASDDFGAMQDAVRYLARLGHRQLARVSGISRLWHTHHRDQAFLRTAADLGLPEPTIVPTDYGAASGSHAVRDLLMRTEPPTAIIFDNDILAVAGLSVAAELGLQVPDDVSLLAWDDSPLCSITHPPLSAMRRDVADLGAAATALLLRVISGADVTGAMAGRAAIHPRGSTRARHRVDDHEGMGPARNRSAQLHTQSPQ